MANPTNNSISANGDFKEAVCIDGGRVFDSCCDRDCLEDLRVYFSTTGQPIINSATNIRNRGTEVASVFIDVEPVNLNKGFYCCDITFYFLTTFDVYAALCTQPTTVQGISQFSKKVILYGSESKVKVFSNEACINGQCEFNCPVAADVRSDVPKCVVQCIDPITLDSSLSDVPTTGEVVSFPASVIALLDSELYTNFLPTDRTAFITVGIFTVIELIRNVQMLIPVYDYCIPEKECNSCTDNPCDTFSRLKFPTEEFYPQQLVTDSGRFCN